MILRVTVKKLVARAKWRGGIS